MRHVVIIFIALMSFIGCKSSQLAETNKETKETKPAVVVKPVTSAPVSFPEKGWLPQYDTVVLGLVSRLPEFSKLPTERMAPLCPKWKSLSQEKKVQLWGDLIYTIASAESSYNRLAMFSETGIKDSTGKQVIDSVTKLPIVSEGLMQLSYADMNSYPPNGITSCTFNWGKDRLAFEEDFKLFKQLKKVSVISKHPERSILNPEIQMSCTVHIMRRLITSEAIAKKYPDIRDALGRYWSTMRPKSVTYQTIVKPRLVKKAAYCF